MTSNTYEGLHARYYDVVYGEKPYADEARSVDALLDDAGIGRARLLDVACGTGRHADELSSLGWAVTGVDYSESLLEHARLNAPTVRFLRQDMRELDVPDGPFEAVTCLFDSIGYPVEDEGVLAALAGMRRHAVQGGAIVVEFLHAPALLRHASPLGVRKYELPDGAGGLLRISRTRLDEPRSVMEVEYEVIELNADQTYTRWREVQTNRFFTLAEMSSLMEAADLHLLRFVSAYDDARDIDEETFHVIALARVAA